MVEDACLGEPRLVSMRPLTPGYGLPMHFMGSELWVIFPQIQIYGETREYLYAGENSKMQTSFMYMDTYNS